MIDSLWSAHGVHLGTLVGPALLLAFWACWADVRAWLHRRGDTLAPAVLTAALLSAGAGLAHLLVCPSHFVEDPLYGVFFAGAAAAQIGWAVTVVLRPGIRLLALGVAGNLGVLSLWVVTRTVGVPLGVAAGQREVVGPLDLATALLELGVVVCCIMTARSSLSRDRRAGV